MRDFSQIPPVEIYTLHELVHRLILRVMGTDKDRTRALAVRAIQDAIRSLCAKHKWKYYKRQARMTTSAPLTTNINYDLTGGAHERMATITDGQTWPSDVTYGELIIGDNPYRVMRRISDTVVTLEPDFAYPRDYSGGVVWERRSYTFTREIVKLVSLVSLTGNRHIEYLPSSEFSAADRSRWGSGLITYCTLHNQGSQFGGTELTLIPSPIEVETLEATATVAPIIPKIELVSGTDAAVTDYDVTVSGASFTKKLIGSVFRLGSTDRAPTHFDSDQWDHQAFITDVPSATTLTLSEAIPAPASERGYAISSPIDIHTSVMLEALEDEAFFQYTKNHDHKSIGQAKTIAMSSLREAMARDNTVSLDGYMWNSTGWWGRWFGGFYTIANEQGGTTVGDDDGYAPEYY